VGEVIGCSICLNGQLELGNYLVVNNNLQGYIANRNFISEPVFNLF
jgi:hypothetical protein